MSDSYNVNPSSFAGVTADGANVKDPNLTIASQTGKLGMRSKNQSSEAFNKALETALLVPAPALHRLVEKQPDPHPECESQVWGQVFMMNLFNADWYKDAANDPAHDTLEHDAA